MIFIIILVISSLILIPFLRGKSRRTSLTWFACQPTKKMVLHPGPEKKREALKRRMPTFPHPTHPNPIKPLKAILSKHHITPRNNTMH